MGLLCLGIAVFVTARFLSQMHRPNEAPSDRDSGQAQATPAERQAPRKEPAELSVSPSVDARSRPPATVEQLTAEAEQVARDLGESLPKSAEALALIGRIYFRFNNTAKATEHWEKCLAIDPGFADAYRCLGLAARARGDYDAAIAHFRKALACNPAMRDVPGLMAHAFLSVGKAAEAAAALEKTASAVSRSPSDLVLLGQSYLQLEEYGKAKASFEAAMAAAPGLGSACYGLSQALARLGEVEKSREMAEKFFRMKTQEVDNVRARLRDSDVESVRTAVAVFCFEAARVYATHGKLEKSEEHLLKALAAEPKNSELRATLDRFRLQYGRPRGSGNAPKGGKRNGVVP